MRRLGVANTLVRRKDGTIFADNTDVLGFSWLLEDFCRRELGASAREALGGREAIVLGSGGASRAVVPVLRDAGCRTSVISRTGDDTYETLLERHADAALVVNTTPVGTYPDCPASPLAPGVLERMASLAGVVDAVYNPERTGICLEAERLGIPSQSGLGMLVSQAYFASQLFQGRSLPSRLVGDISQDIAHKSRNIALIGMPGVGKTTTGRQLARIENRPFVDLDDAFEIAHGMSAAECIERCGEEEFRRLETAVCADWCSRSGLVVSCGGGIVTRPENYALLHQNARGGVRSRRTAASRSSRDSACISTNSGLTCGFNVREAPRVTHVKSWPRWGGPSRRRLPRSPRDTLRTPFSLWFSHCVGRCDPILAKV